MNEPGGQDNIVRPSQKSETIRLSHRRFLQLIGGTGVAIGLLSAPDISLDFILSNTPESLAVDIPNEFKDIEMPARNEYFRSSEAILREGFDIYNIWRKNTSLAPITFKPRDNYLTTVKFLIKFKDAVTYDDEGSVSLDLNKVFFRSAGTSNETELTKDDVFGFSAFDMDGVSDVLAMDQGAGIVSPVMEGIKTIADFNNIDLNTAQAHISQSLLQAKAYFESQRGRTGEPLSPSIAIAYFLQRNNGDLYKSMWDTTLFFKMFARNDLLTLKRRSQYDQAEELGYLFKDEFSPHISHNWLIDKFKSGIVSKNSPLYSSSSFENQSQKSFMPINTAGTYYHCLNLLTWASVCMEPTVVKAIVAGYYNAEKLNSPDFKQEHGKEKIRADMLVAQKAGQIKGVVDKYAKAA